MPVQVEGSMVQVFWFSLTHCWLFLVVFCVWRGCWDGGFIGQVSFGEHTASELSFEEISFKAAFLVPYIFFLAPSFVLLLLLAAMWTVFSCVGEDGL